MLIALQNQTHVYHAACSQFIYCCTLILLLTFSSCDNDVPPGYYGKKKEIRPEKVKSPGSLLVELQANVILCDSCESVLIVEHNECTECRDFYVDSGTVYISNTIVQQLDSTVRANQAKEISSHKLSNFGKRINTYDFYFDTKADFAKLWKGYHFESKYRIKGHVIFSPENRLKFKMKSFEKLSKTEAKRFE
jgi:hypothetical protein